METNLNELKIAFATCVGILTGFWGWLGWLVLCWVCCMVLDYITGSMAAGKAGETLEKGRGQTGFVKGDVDQLYGCLRLNFMEVYWGKQIAVAPLQGVLSSVINVPSSAGEYDLDFKIIVPVERKTVGISAADRHMPGNADMLF